MRNRLVLIRQIAPADDRGILVERRGSSASASLSSVAVLDSGSLVRSFIESTLVSPSGRRRLMASMVLPSLSSVMNRVDQIIENSLLGSSRAASTSK